MNRWPLNFIIGPIIHNSYDYIFFATVVPTQPTHELSYGTAETFAELLVPGTIIFTARTRSELFVNIGLD